MSPNKLKFLKKIVSVMYINVRHGMFYGELEKISKVNKQRSWGRLANAAIRYFIEIKSSDDLVKISAKRT